MQNHTALWGLAAITAAVGSVTAQEQTGTLKYRDHKNFNFVMPKEVWTPTAGGIQVKHPNGASFKVVSDGPKMEVDTSGTGRTNAVVKGTKGFLRFTVKGDGETFRYAARFQGTPGKYSYQSSCSMSGTVGKVPITLFDLNNNGLFGEYGEDAMIVGSGNTAGYVSKVITYGGQLYNLEVTPDGKTVKLTDYQGESGSINIGAGFKASGKLESAIVSDGNGNTFEVADKSSVVVPVGEYTIVAGLVKKGSQIARIRAGKMAPIVVKTQDTAKLRWGGPLTAEFTHTLADSKVTVDPKDLKYYGMAGEEYFGWAPDAKSPKFKVHDPATGREVGNFIFHAC